MCIPSFSVGVLADDEPRKMAPLCHFCSACAIDGLALPNASAQAWVRVICKKNEVTPNLKNLVDLTDEQVGKMALDLGAKKKGK